MIRFQRLEMHPLDTADRIPEIKMSLAPASATSQNAA